MAIIKKRYYRTTKGYNAEVIVAPAVAYTTDATFEDFVDNAVEGEIGVFNADTMALLTDSAAITDGTRFFIAQKRNGEIFKTTASTYNSEQQKPVFSKRVAYTAPVKQVSTVTFSSTYTPAKDDAIIIKIIETTPGNEQFPTWDFVVSAKAGEARSALLTRLAAVINDAKNPQNQELGAVVTASLAGDVLTLTAANFESSFRIALPGLTYDVATVAYTTPFTQGSGYYEHVASLELEGNIYDGVTTQWPGDGFNPVEFGQPTQFAKVGSTYNLYYFFPIRDEKSPTPVDRHFHYHNIVLAVELGANSPNTALGKIFGFDAI